MKKSLFLLIIFFCLGLFLYSCDNNSQYFNFPTIISTPKETLIPTQLSIHQTPTLNQNTEEKSELIITLGEPVNRQGWWPAIPAFSLDGKTIALASERVRLWNVETHELIHELVRPYSNCNTENVTFSTNGDFLATSIYCLGDSNATGHVLIWDTNSGDLLYDWEQKFSKNTSKISGISNLFPATGLAFLPKGSLLAFANGNTIEIRDLQGDHETVVLELGDEMSASDIAISSDGKQLFAFMDFSYFKAPDRAGQKYVLTMKYGLQIWDLISESIEEKIDFPEFGNTGAFIGHFDVEVKLLGKLLINVDYINETFMVTDLETGEIKNLYYHGDVETFVSQDANYVIHLADLVQFDCKNKIMELSSASTNQSIYTFNTLAEDFDTEWCHAPHTIVFNPDNTILAIAHQERVSLLDISSFTNPMERITP